MDDDADADAPRHPHLCSRIPSRLGRETMARHTQSGYSRSNVTGTRSFPSRRGPFIEGVSPLTRYNLDKHTRATRNDHGRHDKVDLYLMSLPHYFAEPTVPPKAVAVDEDEGSTTSPAHPVEGLYSAFSDANRPAPLDRKMGMSHRTTFGHAGTDMVVDGLAFAGGTFDFERPPRHDVTADRNSPERFDGPSIEQLVHVAHQKEEERKEREARAKELERSLRRQVEAERLAEQKENRRKKEKPTGKTHMATDAQGAENMKKTEPVRKAESKKRRRRQVDSDTDSERAASKSLSRQQQGYSQSDVDASQFSQIARRDAEPKPRLLKIARRLQQPARRLERPYAKPPPEAMTAIDCEGVTSANDEAMPSFPSLLNLRWSR